MDVHDAVGVQKTTENEESTDSETSEDTRDSEQSEDEVDEEEGEEEDEYEDDFWALMRARVLKSNANLEISEETLPILRKDLTDRYKQKLTLLQALKTDPIHKKIMSTKRKLEEDDDYDSDEALHTAINMRNYLMFRACKFRDEDFDLGRHDDSDTSEDDMGDSNDENHSY